MSIKYEEVTPAALNLTNHITGHVYLFVKIGEKDFVILGHNEDHDNVASFGGFIERGEPKETVRQTILREFQEETLGVLMNSEVLSSFLQQGRIITRQSPKGHHFTVFCQIGNFNIDGMNNRFVTIRQNQKLTEAERENDYLVALEVEKIKEAIERAPNDKEVYVDGIHLRDINVAVFKWFFSN